MLRCPACRGLVTTVDVSAAAEWVETQVDRKRQLSREGRLRTRKQSTRESDEEIDRAGLSAELAACAMLCPAFLYEWIKAAQSMRNNRGRDLRCCWTGLNKPVEVKYTRYQDERRGFLLVRPPRGRPGRMRREYIDDSFYVLVVGTPWQHTLIGWTDRQGLLIEGQRNPVPVQSGQRESWGIHWSRLRDPQRLADQAGLGGRWGALRRWLADWL